MKMIYDPVSIGKECVLLEGVVKQDSKDKPKEIKLVGRQCIAECENINGRNYPFDVMSDAVNEFNERYVTKNRAFGELEHPLERTIIDPSQACDRMIKIYSDPDNKNAWIGESLVMASDPAFGIHGTPKGDTLAAILQHGGEVGRSTRGVGDFNESSGIVQPGYRIVCIDTVIDPSGPGCYSDCIIEGVLQNREFMINEHGDMVEIAYNHLKSGLSRLPVSKRDFYVAKCIREFINSI